MNECASIDEWLFTHAVIEGHTCIGLKDSTGCNYAYRDNTTGEEYQLREPVWEDSDGA